ncbi:MAG: GNAT family N-acetyltransferase [Acidobacteriia bacterium]|nr:GNAT family N-acetyltransferase [Terriglobia bacterium]
MILRSATIDDRAAVEEILVSSAGFSEEEVRVGLEVFNSAILGDYSAFAADVDGRARGYLCVAPIAMTASTWHLYWIGVHGGFQRLGLGRALLAHVEDFIRFSGGERITLETSGRKEYEGARLFYEAAGYQAAGRIRDFYKPGDDCVIYCKELP